MNSTLKKVIKYIVIFIFSFGSSYYFPGFLLWAFNYSKGIQINDDGIMFIPLGFFLCFLILLFYFLIIRKTIKSKTKSRIEKILIVSIIVIIIAVCVFLSLDTYKLFFKCFSFYKGLPNVSRYC